MPDDEGESLFRSALAEGQRNPQGTWLEVGAYCGKSAVYLGAAAEETSSVLYSLDHHHGSEENQSGWEHHDTTGTLLGSLYGSEAFRLLGWTCVWGAVALTVIRGLPVITDAIKDQLDRISHSSFLGLSNVPAIQLAEKLSVLTGMPRVFYSDDGSTAMEVALKVPVEIVKPLNGWLEPMACANWVAPVVLVLKAYAPSSVEPKAIEDVPP